MSGESQAIEEWKKEGTLGKGTFGRVTLWRQKITHEAIAIKECCVQLNSKNRLRWREEIDMLTKIQHQNLVGVRDIPLSLKTILNTSEPCLGMELCEGGDLRKVLNQPANSAGLNEMAVLNVLKDVTNAVRFLHSHKIIHRDLKPENILISFIGDKVIYKITDLGYAKHLDQSSVADSFVGTMKYVAPEVFSSKEGYTVTADFWSLGNVIFECITGYRPFDFEKSFVEWHAFVSKKCSRDICGSDQTGEVTFHTTIPPPYKLASPLIPMFEEWLRLVMEWNPETRGGQKDDSGVRKCYRLAEQILLTKVVHVFSVNKCKLLSFKIEEDDAVQDLQERMKEDMYLNEAETTLILANGKILHPDGSLLDCYNQPGDSEWLIYAINTSEVIDQQKTRKKSLLGKRNVYQSLPESVRFMVEKPEELKPHSELKRIFGHSLYFVTELAKSYRKLLQAQRAIMITLMSCNSELMQGKDEMKAVADKLSANLELFIESCENDLQMFHQMGFHTISANQQYPLELKGMIEKALTYQKNLADDVIDQITAAQRELINLKNNPLVTNQDTELDNIAKLAKEHYENLLKSEKSKKEPFSCQYMSNLILQVSPIWDRLESDFYQQLRKVLNCKQKMELLIPEISRVIDTIQGFRQRLHKMMKQKQEMTWKTLTGGMAPVSLQASSGFGSMTNALASIIEESQQEEVDSLSLIEENKGGLDRLEEILQDLKEVAGADTTKGKDRKKWTRTKSTDTNFPNLKEPKTEIVEKRRAVSDPPWTVLK